MARAEIVDGLRNQFFASAGFATDEYGRISGCNRLHLGQDAAQRHAIAYDLLKICCVTNVFLDLDTLLGKLLFEFTNLLVGYCLLYCNSNLIRDLHQEINFSLSEWIVATPH